MNLLHNIDGPIGCFQTCLERNKTGPEGAYNTVVDTFPQEPYCYHPEVFTPQGLLAVFDVDISEDEELY